MAEPPEERPEPAPEDRPDASWAPLEDLPHEPRVSWTSSTDAQDTRAPVPPPGWSPTGFMQPPQPPAPYPQYPPSQPYGYGHTAPQGYQGAWAQPAATAVRPKGGSARTGPLPLHPMGLGDVLDGSFKLLRANARTLVIITAVIVGPVQMLAAFAQRSTLGGRSILTAFNDPSVIDTSSGDAATTVAALLSFAAQLLVLPFVAGAISKVVAASYLGGELGPGPALRATLRRWWALIAAWVLVHILEVVGAVFCLLPGLLAMALFVAVAPAIVVEEIGPIRGMRRSWRLMSRRLFPVLGIALLVGLMASVLGSVLGTVPQLVALVVGLRWGWILLGLGAILASLVTTPFVAITSTLLYFDGRIRHEGFDLQLMAADLSRSA